MVNVKAIFDGTDIVFKDKINFNTPHMVIVTYYDKPDEGVIKNGVLNLNIYNVRTMFDGSKVNFVMNIERKLPMDVMVTFLGKDEENVTQSILEQITIDSGAYSYLFGPSKGS